MAGIPSTVSRISDVILEKKETAIATTGDGLLHGSVNAPIIAFDNVQFFGTLNGIGRLTLSTQVLSGDRAGGVVAVDHRVTVHLRGSLNAMAALRDTIDKMLLAATPIEGASN